MSEITEKLINKHRLIFSGDIWKKSVIFEGLPKWESSKFKILKSVLHSGIL